MSDVVDAGICRNCGGELIRIKDSDSSQLFHKSVDDALRCEHPEAR